MTLRAAKISTGFNAAPYRLSGSVYGVLLNHRSAVAALGDAIGNPPYNAEPKSPVLFIKPRNTLVASGECVGVSAETPELEIGACLGLVIGKTACNVKVSEALQYVAGYLIVDSVSIPHEYYRPGIRQIARDGFCSLGPVRLAGVDGPNPDALTIRTYIDGVLVQLSSTAELVRPAATLLSDVTEFMTLAPGDVLCLGAAAPAPRVRAGQTVRIEIDGFGALSNSFVSAASASASPMSTVR
jgi:5-oxopent-3-ene-1,2,5-tricarboxylate decarboxylase/2-hydroxyhepta-2,4-diene-1,7-dioate isomerase